MMSFTLIFFYYWFILFSILGYGFLFSKFFLTNSKENMDIGYVGLFGIFFLLLISYSSILLLPHTIFFNSVIMGIGFTCFWIFRKKFFFSNYFKFSIYIFLFLAITIYAAKNHDDFPYYHFPYTHLLTEHKALIGIGNFNHGFRTHSSIFYLSSLFYLPFVKYYLFHLAPVFFLGLSNLILFKKIKENLTNQNNLYLIYLSLFSIIFINIFFYRIGEHGTDRSAMILIIVLVIEILSLTNLKKKYEKEKILKLIILISIIFSLKAFYIIYCVLFLLIYFYSKEKKDLIIFLLKNKVTYLVICLISFVLFTNFLNTGCLIYPAKILCFDSFQWSIPLNEVEKMNHWYQLWSKAGANPNFRIDNADEYIKNFNWVNNWFEMYFFNKVSDFIFGLLFVILIFFTVFFRDKVKVNLKKKYFLFLYIILLVLFFEWFYFHPALRYGGYNLMALLVFIPASIILEKYSGNKMNFKKKVYFILILGICVFFGRNLARLNKEYKAYNFNPLKNSYYKDFQQNYIITEKINKIIMCNSKKNVDCEYYIKTKKKYFSHMFYKKK